MKTKVNQITTIIRDRFTKSILLACLITFPFAAYAGSKECKSARNVVNDPTVTCTTAACNGQNCGGVYDDWSCKSGGSDCDPDTCNGSTWVAFATCTTIAAGGACVCK